MLGHVNTHKSDRPPRRGGPTTGASVEEIDETEEAANADTW
jgi:hypothetical protein